MIVLMILIVALIACVMFLYFYRKHEKATGHTPYIEALIALLENRENLAMKKFKEAVSIDSDLVDAYVRLGDLYRKKGDVERAIQIHQSLTVRPTLNKHEEKKVYLALVNDMLEATRLNKATSFLKEIIKIDKKDKHARELILKIYEDMGNYVDCIALYEEGGIRSCEIGTVMLGEHAVMELVRLAIPRRTYTQSHIDYVIEVILMVKERARQLPGYRIVEAPPALPHFSATFEPIT